MKVTITRGNAKGLEFNDDKAETAFISAILASTNPIEALSALQLIQVSLKLPVKQFSAKVGAIRLKIRKEVA